MIIISDCPNDLEGFARQETAWNKKFLDELIPVDRRIWRSLSTNDHTHVAEGLDPEPPGSWSRTFVIGEAPSSQFDILHTILGSGVKLHGPVACIALSGKKFHGHRGHHWVALRGNLHLCVGLMPESLPASSGLALTMLPAVAVVDAIDDLMGGADRAGIKWVNDIIINGKKVAGVITNTHMMNRRVTAAIFGIGLNVSRAPHVVPTPFVPAAGCLGGQVSLAEALNSVLTHFAKWYHVLLQDGPGPVFEAYRAASIIIGREVCIWDYTVDNHLPEEPFPPPQIRGRVTDISEDLSIWLKGSDKPVNKGRLALAEFCPAPGAKGIRGAV